MIPGLKTGIPTTVIGGRIPNQLLPTLQKIANDRGVSPSALATQALMEFIDAQTIKNPTAN